MCGIFGFSFKNNMIDSASKAILTTNLARYNDIRGGHSWGIVGVQPNTISIDRGLGLLSDYAYKLCGHNSLFAHTRYASSGEVSIENAHPFEIGNIVGSHNGSVYNSKALNQKYNRAFEVDSQHVFAHLNEGRSFKELIGRGAVEWVDKRYHNLIFLSKLFAGELAVYGVGDFDNPFGVIWSSSYKHLLKSMESSGINKYFRYDIYSDAVYSVSNGTIVKEGVKSLTVTPPIMQGYRALGV